MIISIETTAKRAVLDITQNVVDKLRIDAGLVHVFAQHTTVGLAVADLDPGADQDYLEAIEKLVPEGPYRHPHNPEHMPDHIASVLLQTDVTVPVRAGSLSLGNWQRLVLFEFDGPRTRKLVITQISSV